MTDNIRTEHARTRAPYVYIQPLLCTGCEACVEVCPFQAIRMEEGVAVVDPDLCRNCRICIRVCPEGAIM